MTTLSLRGKGLVRGGGGGGGEEIDRPVPQRELRVLEPPSCSLYHEGANGFPREHPFRVGLNGLDTIPQHKLRVRPMPPDPDPNSVVAQTGPQPERSRPGPIRLPIKNTRSAFSRQNPVFLLEENGTNRVPRTHLISADSTQKNPPSFGSGGRVGAENSSKLSPSQRRLAEAKKKTPSQHVWDLQGSGPAVVELEPWYGI